jgi:hypothetical protein
MDHKQLAAANEQRAPQRHKPRGRPWPPGVSGNPDGARTRGKRFAELYDNMAADFGGAKALTSVQAVMLAQSVRLLMRAEREKNAEDAVRLSNAAMRMLGTLRNGRRKAAAPTLSLRERLAAEAEAEAAP